MKCERVELLKWIAEEDEQDIDIDWPKVHRSIGSDHLNWLLKQPEECCQIVLERQHTLCRLVVEFYSDRSYTEYHMLWAK